LASNQGVAGSSPAKRTLYRRPGGCRHAPHQSLMQGSSPAGDTINHEKIGVLLSKPPISFLSFSKPSLRSSVEKKLNRLTGKEKFLLRNVQEKMILLKLSRTIVVIFFRSQLPVCDTIVFEKELLPL